MARGTALTVPVVHELAKVTPEHETLEISSMLRRLCGGCRKLWCGIAPSETYSTLHRNNLGPQALENAERDGAKDRCEIGPTRNKLARLVSRFA